MNEPSSRRRREPVPSLAPKRADHNFRRVFYGYLEVARANHLINFPVVKVIYLGIIFLYRFTQLLREINI